ncbi:hypothetical protein P22_3688 [Propionispora sp. 2/2-37]|uniref:diacylglycerol/lipid kinase family protein n=1 Tax=Propionispora sp. 2/2-37 TaxID=1677858 RepID=UPI0006BB962B|nr:YegS/Rv2252/BmrU family lipid kinase [Propionispora sp. 2/2-37]CUH97557.1 hypothetical protein P22_3688 [Propionispora sp. 2/2-37]
MRRFLLIYNPLSGNTAFKTELDYVIQLFQRQHCLLIPARTEKKEDTPSFIQWAEELHADGIIAAGGDGTIHEVVNAMLEANTTIPLGLIPCGTSNDFAAFLKIDRSMEQCVGVITGGRCRSIDVGMINDKYFMNVASAGLLASVVHKTDTTLKNTLGKVAYYLKSLEALPNFRSLPIEIHADGLVIKDDILLFLVMNSGVAGGFTNLAPAARLDDGKLDLLIVNRCNVTEFMRLLIALATGNHTNHKNITYLQARDITITCDEPLESDLDGELGPPLPLRLSALPNRLKVFMPQ